MTQHDRRQLLNMQQKIKNYKENKISLDYFINNIDFLYRELNENNKKWNMSIFNELTSLDAINAGVPDEFSEELIQDILYKGVSNLEKLVNERLLELGAIKITLRELDEKFTNLLNKKRSREEVANWAYDIIQQDELENILYLPFEDKEQIVSGLLFLCEIDHKDQSGNYICNEEKIKNKSKEIILGM